MEVLLLCTANQCRSPMAQGLLEHRLAGVDPDVRVSSAGLLPGGAPATDHAIKTLARRRIDLTQHRSRTLTPELVAGADLVIGMAREHVREAVVLDGSALTKSFTLKEIVTRAERVGPRNPEEPLRSWLGWVGAGRRAADLLGPFTDPNLDIADPIGGPASGYERTAAEIDELLGRLVELAWRSTGKRERSA